MRRFFYDIGAAFSTAPALAPDPAEGLSGIFMRHAQKQRGIDPGLTNKGFLQAISSGRNMAKAANNPVNPATPIVFSPYKRTIQTGILALAMQDFDPDHPPEIHLDPRLSEFYKDPSCRGTMRSELLEWIADPAWLDYALEHAVTKNKLTKKEAQALKDKALALIENMVTDRLKEENWWPVGINGGRETEYDVRNRALCALNEHTGDDGQPPFFMTHSTLMMCVSNHIVPDEAKAFYLSGLRITSAYSAKSGEWGPDPSLR